MRISDWSSDVCSSDLQIFGNVADLEHVDAGFDAHAVGDRNEHFHRRVAGAGTHAAACAVDAARAGGDRGDRVGDAHRQIVMTVETDLGFGLGRSEEHTYELQSLMRISSAVFCL